MFGVKIKITKYNTIHVKIQLGTIRDEVLNTK